MENKATISRFLLEKAKSDLLTGIDKRKNTQIDTEIQIGINVNLLLGIALEGVINHLGEKQMGECVWKEIEKALSPDKKWVLLQSLSSGFVDKGKEPFQTIVKAIKVRNEIAHPKLDKVDNDVNIITNSGEIILNPSDDYVLPDEDLSIYVGYDTYIRRYNVKETYKNMKKVLETIIDMKKLLPNEFDWCNQIYDEIKSVEIK